MAPRSYDINRLRQQSLMQGFNSPSMQMQEMPQIDTVPFNQPGPVQPELQPPQYPQINTVPFQQGPMPIQQPSDDPMARINQVYTPETTSRDRFNRLLDTMPEREEPGWARRLVAGGMGLGDKTNPIQTMESVMYAPYMRDVAAWKEKTGPYQQAAAMENTANINERTLAGNVLAADAAQKRTEAQQATATERNRIALIRETANAAKAAQWKIEIRGNQVIAISPDSPPQMKVIGTTNGMTEEDIINLKGEWSVKVQEARGIAQRSNVEVAGWNTYQYPDGTVVQENNRTGEKRVFPPGSRVPVPDANIPTEPMNRIGTPSQDGESDTPAQMTARRQLRLRQIYQNYPEYQDLFTQRQDGTLELRARPGYSWLSGDPYDHEQMRRWDKLNKIINPDYKPTGPAYEVEIPAPPSVNTPMPRTPPPPPSAPPPPPQGSNRGVGPLNVPTPNNMLRNRFGITEIPGTPAPKQTQNFTPIQQRAAEQLQRDKKPVTPANIEYLIKSGQVK